MSAVTLTSPTRNNLELTVRIALSGIKLNRQTSATLSDKQPIPTPRTTKPLKIKTNPRCPTQETGNRQKPEKTQQSQAKQRATKEQRVTNRNNQSRTKAPKQKPLETRKITKIIVKNRDAVDTTLKKGTPNPPNAKAKKIESRFENALLFKLNAHNTNQSSGKDNSIWLLRAGYTKREITRKLLDLFS